MILVSTVKLIDHSDKDPKYEPLTERESHFLDVMLGEYKGT